MIPSRAAAFLKAGRSVHGAGWAGGMHAAAAGTDPALRSPAGATVPGKPIFYATAMPFHGHALPLLVETHEYRPTKIEGNPAHAASMGATDLFAQASILNLYDPDRSTTLTNMGESRSWGDFAIAVNSKINDKGGLKDSKGAGLRFLTGAVSSPTFGWQMKAVQQIFPQSKWHRWDPVNRDNMRAGSKLALGGYYDPVYKFENAAVVVSLDADFLSGAWFPGFVRYAPRLHARPQAGKWRPDEPPVRGGKLAFHHRRQSRPSPGAAAL